MEVGLDGNIFTRDYDKLEYLSSHSWFKATWALCWRFRVNIRISAENDIPPSRDGDYSITEALLNNGSFGKQSIMVLKRICRFKKVHSMADIVRCDGKTVDPSVLDNREGNSTRIFSREKPRPTDVANLWATAIRRITSPDLILRRRIGDGLKCLR